MAGIKDSLYSAISKNRTFSRLLAKTESSSDKGDKFSKDVDKAISRFVPEAAAEQKTNWRRELYFAKTYYGVTPEEYFLFHFENRPEDEKHEFVGSYEKDRLCRKINTQEKEKLADKYEAYRTFTPYYHREMIRVETEEDREAFESFARTHKSFMIKAIRKAKGNDVFRIDLSGEEEIESLKKKLKELGTCVVEECVCQCPEMEALHPESVNTIRYATWYDRGKLTRMYAVLRMGQGSSHVDNAGAGGIAASVDLETGIVRTDGYCEDGRIFEKHPDTGVAIRGYQIPRWGELNQVICELVKVVPGQKFVGWDMALTPDGWVMIEGNSRPMITAVQMCEQKGIRDLVNKTLAAG